MTHPELDLSKHAGANYAKGRGKVWQAGWFLTLSLFFTRWWLPAKGRIWILRSFGAKVGHGVYIRHGVRVHWPWNLTIGANTWIGEGAWILNLAPIQIGANSCISQEVLLVSGSHDRGSPSFEHKNAPIHIGTRVWVCARAIVTAGVQVGDGSVIPAGAIVRHDITPDRVAGTDS